MTPIQATMKVQCKDPDGNVGDFLFLDDKRISPLFTSLAELYPWMKANGWKQDAQATGKPWGVVKCLTERQERCLKGMRRQEGDFIAAATERHWLEGESYYLDDRTSFSQRTKADFNYGNKVATNNVKVK